MLSTPIDCELIPHLLSISFVLIKALTELEVERDEDKPLVCRSEGAIHMLEGSNVMEEHPWF